jgi:hypothetical protein
MVSMSTTTLEPTTTEVSERERTAVRLLRSSAKVSFDPQTEVDWDAPQPADVRYAPERCSSLYGTPLWEAMTPEQRATLTKHEVASIASVGIWFEEILMQMLLRYAYDRDLTRKDVQWALTEIADECRHSIMFASMTKAFGAPNYGVSRVAHELGRIFKTISNNVLTFAGTMYVEEILDGLQREAMDDESVQQIVRQVSRIHVIEEARHISYAREETLRAQAESGLLRRTYNRIMIGLIVHQATGSLIHPDVYTNAGLDSKSAQEAAADNPHWRETKTRVAEKVLAFFDECGLIGVENRWLLRRAGVLPA